jgi:hypothetical protein
MQLRSRLCLRQWVNHRNTCRLKMTFVLSGPGIRK